LSEGRGNGAKSLLARYSSGAKTTAPLKIRSGVGVASYGRNHLICQLTGRAELWGDLGRQKRQMFGFALVGLDIGCNFGIKLAGGGNLKDINQVLF